MELLLLSQSKNSSHSRIASKDFLQKNAAVNLDQIDHEFDASTLNLSLFPRWDMLQEGKSLL